MTFEVGKLPESYTRRRGKYSPLTDALLELSAGQAIKVPRSEFSHSPGESISRSVMRATKGAKALRQRIDGDHYWLWLEPSGRVDKASEGK